MYIIGIHKVKSFKCSSAYRWSLLLIILFTISTPKVTNTKTKPTIITKTTIIIFPLRRSRCDPMMGRRALVGAHLQRWTREPTFAISKRPATPTACSAVSQSHSQNEGSLNYFLLLNWCKKNWHWGSIISRINKQCLTDFTNLAI